MPLNKNTTYHAPPPQNALKFLYPERYNQRKRPRPHLKACPPLPQLVHPTLPCTVVHPTLLTHCTAIFAPCALPCPILHPLHCLAHRSPLATPTTPALSRPAWIHSLPPSTSPIPRTFSPSGHAWPAPLSPLPDHGCAGPDEPARMGDTHNRISEQAELEWLLQRTRVICGMHNLLMQCYSRWRSWRTPAHTLWGCWSGTVPCRRCWASGCRPSSWWTPRPVACCLSRLRAVCA